MHNFKQVVLSKHAFGEITTEHFSVVDREIPTLEQDQFLIQNIYCGTDPYMRVSMNPGEIFPNYPMVKLNEGIPGESVGVVVESKNNNFPVGTYLWHKKGWREYAVGDNNLGHFKFSPDGDPDKFCKDYLTYYSLVGRTAYYSLTRVLNIKPGQVLGLSGATGGVGNMIVQFGKLLGASVYGITSTQEKTSTVNELGGTGVLIPKKTSINKMQKIIKDHCPLFDAYHENVGNDYFFSALQNMAYSGIMSYCGVMSLYQNTMPTPGPNLFALTVKDVTIRGCNMTKDFVVGTDEWKKHFTWTDDFHNFVDQNRHRLKSVTTIYEGVGAMPQQFVDHFTPENPVTGKSLCKI